MDFYDEMRAIAANVIGDFAQGGADGIAYVEYTAPAGATPDDPGTPVPSRTPLQAVAKGVSFKYIDNSIVSASDLQTTFAAGVIEPKQSGFIELNGVAHKILRIMPKPAAGVPVAYTVVFAR